MIKFNCKAAKELDIVEYLSGIGYQPEKICGIDYWYRSPLRNEITPSFKVNRKLNRWYDHGIGKGGNIIDFAILYFNCTAGEFLQRLSGNFSLHQPFHQEDSNSSGKIEILKTGYFTSGYLIQYLKKRKIPVEIASQFCCQAHFRIKEKTYYSIGFRNDLCGYELRNSFFKCSSTPKGITTIQNGGTRVAVFEGFFDFLSFIVLNGTQKSLTMDFCILNSLSFFEKARPFLERHSHVYLFLDNDAAAQNCSSYAIMLDSRYKDESRNYNGFKDLNEFLVSGRASGIDIEPP